MPDNLALVDKNDNSLNDNTGGDFISGSAGGDESRSSSQVSKGSLSPDGSAYVLTEQSDTFTIPPGLLDTLIGGLRGLGGADSITGSESGDIVYGDEGNDTIDGRGGNDLLYGGAGNDFLSGGAGQNGLLGGAGADTLQGGDSADGINGNAGDDVIFGGGGDDFLRGGRGNDIINGGDGNDFLIGDFGNDTLTGGTGQDVFFLRSEGALGSPTFDLITDFQRTIDFIGLSTNLKESDLVLESKVQPSGGSAVDVKVAATGTLLGTVLGVSPDDLKGRFRPYDVEPDRPEEVATIDIPEVKKLSDNRFQMEFPASDGSKYTIVFQDDGNGGFIESVIFAPNPTTGDPGSTTSFSRDGTRADTTFQGSNETARIEYQKSKEIGKSDQGVISQLKDGQVINSVKIPLPIDPSPISPNPKPPTPQPVPPTSTPFANEKFCQGLKDVCTNISKLQSTVDLASKALLVTGAITTVAGGAGLIIAGIGAELGTAAKVLNVVNYVCALTQGTDRDLLALGIVDVLGFGNEQWNLGNRVLKKGGNKIFDFVTSALNFTEANQPSKFDKKTTNFLPQFRKFLADKTRIPFDFCDKPATTPVTPQPTPSTPFLKIEVKPSAIPYQGTANLNVKYSNPDNNSKNIDITGTAQKGLGSTSFLIPEDKKGQGEFNFTLTNGGRQLGGPGSASREDSLSVSIGNGAGGELFDNINYRPQSFDLLAAPGPNVDFLPNVYTVSSLDGLTRR